MWSEDLKKGRDRPQKARPEWKFGSLQNQEIRELGEEEYKLPHGLLELPVTSGLHRTGGVLFTH